MKKNILTLLLILFSIPFLSAQDENLIKEIQKLNQNAENYQHRLDQLEKKIDDLLWFERVGDIADIDKVYIYGPPLSSQQEKNPTAQGAGNPVKFWAYVYTPKSLDPSKKYPLIVFPHGGVHSDFSTYYTHIVRELIAQEYVIIAPEYRGSTGYGKSMYEKIDYGGREVEDVNFSRDFMLTNCDYIDRNRVGIIGWSHGGLIALMNVFNHSDDYAVAYAGVPVSDLIARMGYKTQGYRDLYSADYHIGKTAFENVDEYRKRSPAWNAHKLKTPLLIHTNTNDADVNVLEVEHLIKSLKAEKKNFEYKIYQDIPGGHSFNRMDTKIAREIRMEIYNFLFPYLKPNKKFNKLQDLEKASYQF